MMVEISIGGLAAIVMGVFAVSFMLGYRRAKRFCIAMFRDWYPRHPITFREAGRFIGDITGKPDEEIDEAQWQYDNAPLAKMPDIDSILQEAGDE